MRPGQNENILFDPLSLWFSVSSLYFLRVIEEVTRRTAEKTRRTTEYFRQLCLFQVRSSEFLLLHPCAQHLTKL